MSYIKLLLFIQYINNADELDSCELVAPPAARQLFQKQFIRIFAFESYSYFIV